MDLDEKSLKNFVKFTLGCQCPDDVFNSIQQTRQVKIKNSIVLDSEFIIGNRLLIIIMKLDELEEIQAFLPKIIEYGLIKRNENSLNRFRLVLFSKSPKTVEPLVEKLFAKLTEGDEKVHLHILNEDDIL